MSDYLIVIDMQADYVADGKPYDKERLVAAINNKIASYPSHRVLYVLNRFLWEINKKPKEFADGLSVISNQTFEKRRASCFTNRSLKDVLEQGDAKSLEFIGVDGNYCVKASVLAAISEGYQVTVDLSCLGIINRKKFRKILMNWKRENIILKENHHS